MRDSVRTFNSSRLILFVSRALASPVASRLAYMAASSSAFFSRASSNSCWCCSMMMSRHTSLACSNICWRMVAACASSAPVLRRFIFPLVMYKVGKSKLWETTISPTVSLLFLESQRWAYERVGSGRLFSVLLSSFCDEISCALACNSLLLASIWRSTESMPVSCALIPMQARMVAVNINSCFISSVIKFFIDRYNGMAVRSHYGCIFSFFPCIIR